MAETFSSRSWYRPMHSKCKSYVLIKNTNKWQVAKHLYRKNLQTTTLISLISTHTTHNHTSFASRLYFVVLNTNNLKDTRTWWGQMSWLFYSGHACMRMRWTLGCENIKKLTFPKHFYNVYSQTRECYFGNDRKTICNNALKMFWCKYNWRFERLDSNVLKTIWKQFA